MAKTRPAGIRRKPRRTYTKKRTTVITEEPAAESIPIDEQTPIPQNSNATTIKFNPHRPVSMRPTSNRKTTGANNPNPYNKTYIKKHLSLTTNNWDRIHGELVKLIENNMELITMDLHKEKDDFCARFSVMALSPGILELLPVEEGNEETIGFLMYHFAMLARKKVTSQSNMRKLDTIYNAMAAVQAENRELRISQGAMENRMLEIETQTSTNTTAIATNTSAIATNASAIATNTSAIATNASAIATNTTAIATNTSVIATHTSAIGEMENKFKEAVAENNDTLLARFHVLLRKEVGHGKADEPVV